MSFEKLYNDEVPHLKIAVCVSSTNAKRQTPVCGIWKLSRHQLMTIIVGIIKEKNSNKAITSGDIEKLAITLDEIGPESRIWRLSNGVATWIDNSEPVCVIDYIVS